MDERSKRIAGRLNTPMLIAAALTLPAVAIQESHPGGTVEAVGRTLNWVTWIAFVVELVVMLSVVPNRRQWLRHHPLDVVIVVLTPPILPAGLQSLRVIRLLRLLRLLRLAQLSREVFSLQGLRYATFLAVLTAVGGAAVFVGFERDNQDLTTWDGVYWAITTMTTVGSDIYPTTTGGEVVSVAIVIVGISFVAMLTGAIAQRFLKPEVSEAEASIELGSDSAEAAAIREVEQIQTQLNALRVSISKLVQRGGAPPPGKPG